MKITSHSEPSRKKAAAPLVGVLLALGAGLCWGFSGTVGQYLFASKGVSAQWVTVVRLVLSGLILLVLTAIRRPADLTAPWKNPKDALLLVIFGIFGLFLVQYSYMQAIFYSDSGTGTAVQYTGEVLILLYTCITLRRLPRAAELGGVGLALLGVFLLATHGDFSSMAISTEGLIWGAIAAVSMMIYTVMPGRLIRTYGNRPVAAYGMLIGGIAAFFLLQFWTLEPARDWPSLLGTAAVVLLGTVVGFSIFLQSTVMIGALKAGLIASVETIAAPALSRLWLHTEFVWQDYLGFACIVSMVVLMALPELRKKQP